jgi:GNAT superfamily N-acetyltransferase
MEPTQAIIRPVTPADFPTLAAMRWDFMLEDPPAWAEPALEQPDFAAHFVAFLERVFSSGNWAAWAAELDGALLAHLFVQRIERVPFPFHLTPGFGYVTNVYTRPAHRNRGLGTRLLEHAQEWAQAAGLDYLMLHPSVRSIPLYARCGYEASSEFMILKL